MEEPRPKRPKPTPSMAPDTDTVCGLRATIIEKEKEIKKLKDENDGMHANYILKDEIIKNMAEEIKKLKDSLKAAARTISGEQVIIEEFQKRIERMFEDHQKRFWLMMEDRGRLIRCLGARSPYTVVDPAGDGTAATPTTNATSSRQASARVPAALAGGDDTAAIATTNATSSQ
jgi:predicted RNase H-like nuclease (RuvC/YqgF family)